MERNRTNDLNIGLLSRPRIQELLKEGLEYPLLIMEAPPGYGKSDVLQGALRSGKRPCIWLRLRRMDNWEFYFWKHFVVEGNEAFPALCARLAEIDFPDTPGKMDEFLGLLAAETAGADPVTVVVDDYSVLENQTVRTFFEHLVEAGLPGIHLAIVSSQPTNYALVCMRSNLPMFYIGRRDLDFTPEETQALCRLYGGAMSHEQAADITRQMEGWPLAVWLSLMQDSAVGASAQNQVSGLLLIHQLFERDYFAAHPEPTRRLLAQLSMMDSFSTSTVEQLSTNTKRDKELLDKNPFVLLDFKTRLYHFHALYHDFLSGKQNMLDEGQRQAAYQVAARALMERGRPEEALPYMVLCQEYGLLVEAGWQLMDMYANQSLVRYLNYHVAQLPAAYTQQHPQAVLLRATLQLLLLEVNNARQMLEELLQQVKAEGLETEIIGEAHQLLGAVAMLQNREDFVEHFRIASECLPRGSRFRGQRPMLLAGGSPLMLADNKPGALARMEQQFAKVVPYMKIVLNGSGPGLDLLFSAEARFATGSMKEAKKKAMETIFVAEEAQQHETLLGGRYLLGRLAVLAGDEEGAEEEIRLMNSYVAEHDLRRMRGVQARLTSMLYIRMGKPDNTPDWLLKDGLVKSPNLESAQNGLVYACYLLEKKKFTKAAALLDYLEGPSKRRGNWDEQLYLLLFRAAAKLKIGKQEEALADLYQAYEKTYANGIVAPFFECAGSMRTLIDTARRLRLYPFDEEWMEYIYAKSSSFAKRLAAWQTPADSAENELHPRLTARRIEILRCLAQGFTQEEIGRQYGISVNTVKSHVRHIYNELDAVNRADAIRIATNLNLI